jgi:IS5 family transposase
MPLSMMRRIHFLQPWFGYSDPAMEEALHDIPLPRQGAGLDEVIPAESPLLRLRHRREQHDLAPAIFAELHAVLTEKGLTLKRGSGVEATLSAAPSSTKTQAQQRDPEMSQTQQGNPWDFGLKAPMGVDAESGRVQSVACPTAKVADTTMMKECLHGEETLARGERGYPQKNRTFEDLKAEDGVGSVSPTKKPKGGELTEEQKSFNRGLSAVGALGEPPLRGVKRPFGVIKVR